MTNPFSRYHLAAVQTIAIAHNTFREAVRSRVFYILLAFAVSLVSFSYVLGFLAIGLLRRVVLDAGLSTISFFSAMTAIFVGIGLIYQEVEKKTIYNVLSKPLSRLTFLVGRYIGLMAVLLVNLAVMVAVLSVVLLLVGGFTPRIFEAALYIYMELTIITAVALFFSSITSPVVSAICTAGFYVIGHTSSSLPQIVAPNIPTEMGKRFVILLYHLLPDLNLLNINNLVVYDVATADGFFTHALTYTILMVAVLLLGAALAFRRRNLV